MREDLVPQNLPASDIKSGNSLNFDYLLTRISIWIPMTDTSIDLQYITSKCHNTVGNLFRHAQQEAESFHSEMSLIIRKCESSNN